MNYLQEQLNLFVDFLKRNSFQGKLLIHEDLSKHCSLKIGGPADLLLIPDSKDDVVLCFQGISKFELPYFILGLGTNILIHDEGIRGVTLAIKNCLNYLEFDEGKVVVGAGHKLPSLVVKALKNGYIGMESLGGIPGTVGGAVIMNAGAYGSEIFDFIDYVEIVEQGKIIRLLPEEIDFRYRYTDLRSRCILEIGLTLAQIDDASDAMNLRKELLRKRNNAQPVDTRNAGSAFKNPTNDYAGRLIEECGLKGHQVGGAKVSEKHANFLINANQSTSADMWELICFVRNAVEQKFGVVLELEWELVGSSWGV